MSSIILASAYAGAAAQEHHGHGGHSSALAPEALGGVFEFSDVRGRAVTAADFKGHWTLLFFGYSRCRSSCTVATPKIVKAARMLREEGLETRAVFVDIDAPPLGLTLRKSGEQLLSHAEHEHGEMNRVAAMRALSKSYDGDLVVLSGTRGQLSRAARAFMVTREHALPRDGEEGHSINHSTRIYFIAPDTKVAGYGYHDADPAELVKTVAALSRAHAG